MADKKAYRVTGDFIRMVYLSHKTIGAARKAAKALAKKWGWSHPGSEPQIEKLTDEGWTVVE